MSIWAVAWAWERDCGNSGAKLVLLALAHFADKEGVCFPGQETLAKMCNVTDRSVRTYLAELEERKLIERCHRHRRDGSRTSDSYKLAGGSYDQPENLSGSKTNQPENPAVPTGKLASNQPEKSSGYSRSDQKDPSVDPSDNNIVNFEFQEFWHEYPRKTHKVKAEQAWKAMKKRPPVADLIADIKRRYAATEIQFIPSPVTYLHQRRWEDEIIQPGARPPVAAPSRRPTAREARHYERMTAEQCAEGVQSMRAAIGDLEKRFPLRLIQGALVGSKP